MKTVEQAAEEYISFIYEEYKTMDHFDLGFKNAFISGSEWQKEQYAWIRVEDGLPKLIEGENYSKDVLVIFKCGNDYLRGVARYCYELHDNGEDKKYYWANCYDSIDGFSEWNCYFDEVICWQEFAELPEFLKK